MDPLAANSAVLDRRSLLRYILQTYQLQGGSISLPVGCTSLEDWLLDALDVPETLRLASSGAALDLTSLCTQPKASLDAVTPTATPNATDTASTRPVGADESSLLRAHLPAKVAALDIKPERLQETAYLIFLSSCGDRASADLQQALRTQLELNEQRGKELAALAAIAARHGIGSLATVEAQLKLLQIVPPSTFHTFRGFATWRRGAAAVAARSLRHAAEHNWRAQSKHEGEDNNAASARRLLAALQGHLRRLSYTDPEEYHPDEDAAALKAMAEVASALASRCQLSGEGASLPPGLKAQLAEQLLRGLFDPLEDGAPCPHAEELLSLLQVSVWPRLGISPTMHAAMFAWVHYCEFLACKEVGLLAEAAEATRKLEGQQQQLAASPADGDAALSVAVLDALSAESVAALSDHHDSLHTLQELQGVLQLLEAAEVVLGRGRTLPSLLERCLKGSVAAEFSRISARYCGADNTPPPQAARSPAASPTTAGPAEIDMSALTQSTEAMFRGECADFAPMLLHRLPTARAVVATELHALFGARLLPWLVSLPAVSPNILKTAVAAQTLENNLASEAARAGAGALSPWDIPGRLEPLMYKWAKEQLSLLEEWLGRMYGREMWVSQGRNGGAAPSAVDVVKVVSDGIDALFALGLPPPAGAAACLAEGADQVLAEYCARVMRDLGSAEGALPPAPPLTRYKKDLAEQAELAYLHATSGGGGGVGANGPPQEGLRRGKGAKSGAASGRVNANGGGDGGSLASTSSTSSSSAAWLPPLSTEQKERIMGPGYESLALRANSLRYIKDSAAGLKKSVVQRWMEAYEGNAKPEWADDLFQGAARAAEQGVQHVFRFAAVKLVCADLRYPIFERLYLHRAESAPLGPVVERIDAALGKLCSGLREDMTAAAATHVCRILASAITHVLLDGGPWRLFSLEDVELVRNDLELMRATFHADGAGLDVETVMKLTQPIEDVLDVMAMDTRALIDVVSVARRQPLGASQRQREAKNSQSSGGTVDSEVALRVLCHRMDHAASKVLKKDFKIPKKLPGGVVSSVGRTLSSAFAVNGPPGGSASVIGRRTI